MTISRPELSVLSSWGLQMPSLFRAASLFALIAMVAAILPKVDLPETAFDERDAPTIQTILTAKAAPFSRMHSRWYIYDRCCANAQASGATPFLRVHR